MLRYLIITSCLVALACGSDSPAAPTPTPPAFSSVDLVVGTGTEATVGRTLTVHYTLWLYDPAAAELKGQFIESSAGSSPFTFTLGTGSVIAGWHQGFPGMRVGGRRRLVIPPSLAYGSQPNGRIPGNSTLVFDVELLSVQ